MRVGQHGRADSFTAKQKYCGQRQFPAKIEMLFPMPDDFKAAIYRVS